MTSTPPRPHPPARQSAAPPCPPPHVPRSLSEGEAFSTLSSLVLAEHTLDSVAATVADLAIATVPGVTHASVVLVHDAKVRTAAFTGPAAAALDERQYEAGFGPCTRAALSGATVHLHHDALATTGSPFAAVAERCGISSVLCLALRMREHPLGSLNLYASGGGEHSDFSESAMAAARVFAAQAAVVLANAIAHAEDRAEADQLRRAMDSRAVIEQAKGVMIARTGVSAEQAFAQLAARSQTSNRKLHQIAAEVVHAAQQAGARPER